jgi:hypothetical protein
LLYSYVATGIAFLLLHASVRDSGSELQSLFTVVPVVLIFFSFFFEFTLKPHCHSFLGRVIKLRSGGSLASKHFVSVKYVPESFNKPNSK